MAYKNGPILVILLHRIKSLAVTISYSIWSSDTHLKWCVSDTDTRMTSVGYVSVKCSIQKVFVKCLTIVVQF